jgi:hypothetical protein
MFADGVALEIDVDEERVEMIEGDGSVVRYARGFLLPLSFVFPSGLTGSTDDRPGVCRHTDVPCVSVILIGA